jgi:Flp pilus assembly protein TadB
MQLQLQNVLLFILIKNLTQDTPVLFGKSKEHSKDPRTMGGSCHQPQQRRIFVVCWVFFIVGRLVVAFSYPLVCLFACFLAFFQRHRLRRRRRRRGAFRLLTVHGHSL